MALTLASKYSNLSLRSCLEDPLGLHKGSSLCETIVDEAFGLGNFAIPPGLEVCWICNKNSCLCVFSYYVPLYLLYVKCTRLALCVFFQNFLWTVA